VAHTIPSFFKDRTSLCIGRVRLRPPPTRLLFPEQHQVLVAPGSEHLTHLPSRYLRKTWRAREAGEEEEEEEEGGALVPVAFLAGEMASRPATTLSDLPPDLLVP